MDAIVNKLLSVRDKFMSEMYLNKPGFTYSACGWFTKNKERTKNQNILSKWIRWSLFPSWYG